MTTIQSSPENDDLSDAASQVEGESPSVTRRDQLKQAKPVCRTSFILLAGVVVAASVAALTYFWTKQGELYEFESSVSAPWLLQFLCYY